MGSDLHAWSARTVACAIALAVGCATAVVAQQTEAVSLFFSAARPAGIETDAAGNVVLVTDVDPNRTQLFKISPAGMLLNWTYIGDLFSFGAGTLVRDEQEGVMYLLRTEPSTTSFFGKGVIYRVNPATLQVTPFIDLDVLANKFWTSGVYNTVTRQLEGLTLGIPTWGDIAIRRRTATEFDLFVAGLTGADVIFNPRSPFIMRLRVDTAARTFTYMPVMAGRCPQTLGGVRTGCIERVPVTAAPGLTPIPAWGIAVRPDGTALATMPFSTPANHPLNSPGPFLNSLLTFSAGFPEDGSTPGFVFNGPGGNPVVFSMTEMTADAAGNFYGAASTVGSPLCNLGASGALIAIPATMDSVICTAVGFPIVRSEGVAVSPLDNSVYMSLFTQGAVYRFTPFFAPPRSTLTVTRTGTGSGTVASVPAGINCGAVCNAEFSKGATVTLSAVAAADSIFDGWSGACSGTGTCGLVLTANASVTATFRRAPQPFTDDPLTTSHRIRAIHVAELRTRINAVLTSRGLPPAAWTDDLLTPTVTPARAVHLAELRSALALVYKALGQMPPDYTDPILLPGVTTMKAAHINELRRALVAVE